MNVSGIRRNIKNIAHNYTDAQVKVREATSNDPWGPPSSLMSEISDLTYNVVAFSEIMQMIWKRLNDHGKNYRHVYKALVLLDYLVKTGNEKVAQQCKENIFAIHTLRDFQYYEDGKDHGINVREKAKQLEALLKDDERLKNERIKALKARERFAQQTTGFGTGTDGNATTVAGYGPNAAEYPPRQRAVAPNDLDLARPQTAGEEELQLQLALAMSREEAEKEEEKRRSDEVRLALAISQSQQDSGKDKPAAQAQQSHLLDLLDVAVEPEGAAGGWVDPWGTPAHPENPPAPVMPPRPKPRSEFLQGASTVGATSSTDAWGMPVGSVSPVQVDAWGSPAGQAKVSPGTSVNQVADPWAPTSTKATPAPVTASADPWSPQPPARTTASAAIDPWAPITTSSSGTDLDDFDLLTANRATNGAGSSAPNARPTGSGANSPFDLTDMEHALGAAGGAKPKKSPESFLGPNSNLVNLENLVPVKPNQVQAANPFAMSSGAALQANPFQAQAAPRPSINELRSQQNFTVLGTSPQPVVVPQQPLIAAQPMMPMMQPMAGLAVPQQQQAGPWGPGPAVPSASVNVNSPTFNPFLA